MKIVVAMSGGVDSSVAAALLAREGHEVIGLSMQLYDQQQRTRSASGAAARSTISTTRAVSRARIGIPHYIVNFERQFEEHVVSDFVREYAAGRTPIPCVHCNGDLKFASLVERAEAFEAGAVATGHYARVERDPRVGRLSPACAASTERRISRTFSSRCRRRSWRARVSGWRAGQGGRARRSAAAGPVGGREAGQPGDLLRAGGRARGLRRNAGRHVRRGAIRDRDGHVLGRHEGVHRFTIGQRKGLGLSSPIPLYVLGIDATSAEVTVGPRDALERPALTASRVNWIAGVPPPTPVRALVKIRHRHADAPATIDLARRRSRRGPLRRAAERDHAGPGRRVL